ncbi:MAG: hypothetical protein IJC68_04085, partial [Firmicutes bacterium]|nr:hypothetical protein [Bacillota bacterium]
WLVRIKNKNFWVAIIPAVLLLIQVIAAVFGFEIDLGDLGNSSSDLGSPYSRLYRFMSQRASSLR